MPSQTPCLRSASMAVRNEGKRNHIIIWVLYCNSLGFSGVGLHRAVFARMDAWGVIYMPMTPQQLTEARQKLGLSQTGLAQALELGKHGDRTVRRWEAGESPISGPVRLAMLWLEHRRFHQMISGGSKWS